MKKSENQFFFLHIPKTAGTTVALTLSRKFNYRKTLSYYKKKGVSFKDFSNSEYYNQFDLIYGHIPFPKQYNPSKSVIYFTFLRKPSSLILSAYKYFKSDDHYSEKLKNQSYTLKTLLQKGTLKNFDNVLVRFLSGNIDKPYLKIDREDLNVAIHNFDTHFKIFGITEYFDESLVLLSEFMNWPPLFYKNENKSEYKLDVTELDNEVTELIEKCSVFDNELYQHAIGRFNSLLEQNKDIMHAKLKELREGNKKSRLILSLRNKLSLFFSYIRIKLNA